jgi:hypothetical protein
MNKKIADIVNHAEVSEKAIERYLVDEVKKLGGVCLKYSNQNMAGYPDRLILLPGAITIWVELKSKGKHTTALQDIRLRTLNKLGYDTYICDNKEAIDKIIKTYSNAI